MRKGATRTAPQEGPQISTSIPVWYGMCMKATSTVYYIHLRPHFFAFPAVRDEADGVAAGAKKTVSPFSPVLLMVGRDCTYATP